MGGVAESHDSIMKKKPDKSPVYYAGLSLDKMGTELCLVLDKYGDVFKFDSPSHITLVKEGIMRQFRNFNAFDDWCEHNHSEFTRMHEQVFRAPHWHDHVPEARCYLWKRLIQGAKDRTTAGNPINNAEHGKLADRRYVLGSNTHYEQIITRQSKVCFTILLDAIKKNGKESAEGQYVTEEFLRGEVIRRQGEINTRQDPWRIFQYYRPTWIRDHHMRLL